MASIENLPDEILLQIFQYFTMKELLRLQQVNQQWRRVASDRTFFSTISITENESNSYIAVLLSRSRNAINHLSIMEHNDIDFLAPLISECINLESLSVKLCSGTGDELVHGLENCLKLNVIILQHTPIQKMDKLLEILSGRPMKKISIRLSLIHI